MVKMVKRSSNLREGRKLVFKNSEDLNTDHLNTQSIWILNFLKFGFQMGSVYSYVLCTRPTIQIPKQYIRKQDGIYLSDIQIVGLSGIQMAFKNRTIWHPTSFWPSNTRLVWYSDSHCTSLLDHLNGQKLSCCHMVCRGPPMVLRSLSLLLSTITVKGGIFTCSPTVGIFVPSHLAL